MQREDLEKFAGAVVDSTLEELIHKGLLKESEELEEWANTHPPVVLVKQSLIDRLRKVFFPSESESSDQAKLMVSFARLRRP